MIVQRQTGPLGSFSQIHRPKPALPSASQQPQGPSPGNQCQPYYPSASEPHGRLYPHPHPVAQPPPLREPPPDGRRHHEAEPYGAMQDYRPPHPPAHAHPPPSHPSSFPSGHPLSRLPPSTSFHHAPSPYVPCDPSTIKRDPGGENPMSQPRCAHSAGNTMPDGLPGPTTPNMSSAPYQPPPPHQQPPSGHGPPPSFHGDHNRRYMSFGSGPLPNMPPQTPADRPGYSTTIHQAPPAPIQHNLPGPYQPMGSYQSGEGPYSGFGVSTPAVAKRKAIRASSACENCRASKAKCEDSKPCKKCKEKNLECKFQDPVPKPGDTMHADILEGVRDIQEMVLQMQQTIQTSTKRVEKVEGALNINNVKDEDENMEGDVKNIGPALHQDDGQYHEYDPDVLPDEEIEAEPGPPIAPGKPSIPPNHTTGAGHLLAWPAIRDMVQPLLDREGIQYPAEFPIRQEEARGVLRVYGRGEGLDKGSAERDGSTDHDGLEVDGGGFSDINTLSPAGESSSGHVGGFSPVNPVDYAASSKPPLTVNALPDFSEPTVGKYVKSFEENILNMHPILLPKELQLMVRRFLESIPKPPTSVRTSTALCAASSSQPPPPPPTRKVGCKRKRSSVDYTPDTPTTTPTSMVRHRLGKPTRTINNAVVLTVLALGKISLHRDCIPGVVHDSEPHATQPSPVVRNSQPGSTGGGGAGSYSHSHMSPPDSLGIDTMPSSSLSSPKEYDRPHSDGRSSVGGSAVSGRPFVRKNYDNIPGLEYFAIASDIIGNQLGGSSIDHVYANVFAGLFYGQLGRVIESHAYIAHASTILMNIMRPTMGRLQRLAQQTSYEISRPRDNRLLFAFWTCQQLESDIVAELPRHQSGLLTQEENMPYPSFGEWNVDESLPARVVSSYGAQLYLRKHLNWIHREFYSIDSNISSDPVSAIEKAYKARSMVEGMEWCPPEFKFEEVEEPADDILSARLRAQYWGAQVITYRPFIKMILDSSHSIATGAGVSEPASVFHAGLSAPRIQHVIDLAAKGIRALVESTRAFHNLPGGRPIITNVFGTAHAQWGNLLVLAACYRNHILRTYVDEKQLSHLFNRTIDFFRIVAVPSSALSIDKRILEGLWMVLFHAPPALHQTESTMIMTPSSGEGMMPPLMASHAGSTCSTNSRTV